MSEPREPGPRRRPAKYRFALAALFGFFAVTAYVRNADQLLDIDRMAIVGFSLLAIFQFVRGWLQIRAEQNRDR